MDMLILPEHNLTIKQQKKTASFVYLRRVRLGVQCEDTPWRHMQSRGNSTNSVTTA